jgi:hypothetical protein
MIDAPFARVRVWGRGSGVTLSPSRNDSYGGGCMYTGGGRVSRDMAAPPSRAPVIVTINKCTARCR